MRSSLTTGQGNLLDGVNAALTIFLQLMRSPTAKDHQLSLSAELL